MQNDFWVDFNSGYEKKKGISVRKGRERWPTDNLQLAT